MESARDECDENGRAIANCERQKLRHRLWAFCARECAGSAASRPPKWRRQKALGPQQTERSAEANLPSGKRVENSALRHLARLHMLSLGGYGSGWRIRPARAFIGSP